MNTRDIIIQAFSGESSDTKEAMLKACEGTVIEYAVTWMKSKPEDYSVRKRVHWDLINDKMLEGY